MSRAAPVAYRSPYPHSREPNCQVPNPIRLTCPIPSTSRYFMSATVPRARRGGDRVARRCSRPRAGNFADRWSLALLLQKFSVTECGQLVGAAPAGCATNRESSQSSPVLWCPAARLHHPFLLDTANLKRKHHESWVIATDFVSGTELRCLPVVGRCGRKPSNHSSPTTLGAWVSRDPASHCR